MSTNIYTIVSTILLKKGISLAKGDIICISCPIEARSFIKIFIKTAYKLGAKYVEIHWDDKDLDEIRANFSNENDLSEPIPFKDDDLLNRYKQNVSWITFRSGYNSMIIKNPIQLELLHQSISKSKTKSTQYKRENPVHTCSTVIPTSDWAHQLFPALTKRQALLKLWKIYADLLQCQLKDPFTFWEEHIRQVTLRKEKLNRLKLKQLQFEDDYSKFSVELAPNHLWIGGSEFDSNGKRRLPNFPSEEVFTANHKYGINGIVHSSKPLIFQNQIIDQFYFQFENGKIIRYDAKVGIQHLKKILELHTGNLYCGEVALLSGDTLVGQTGQIFQTTLLDENAASHLALGCAYPVCLNQKLSYQANDFETNKINFSPFHIDFMFGRKATTVIAVDKDQNKIPLIIKGKWVI